MKLLHPLQNQDGISLMLVLVMVVVVGLTAGLTGSTWRTVMQREREAELLWRGNQYRRAITSYYSAKGSAGSNQYPSSLEDLLRDPRSLQLVRHIRKLYKDPITGEDWVPILAQEQGGRIKGVRSSSPEEPLKKDGFDEDDKEFANKLHYSDWEFIYKPKTSPSARPTTSPQPTTTTAPQS